MPLDANCRDATIELFKFSLDKVARGIVEESIVGSLNNIKNGFQSVDQLVEICR